MIPWIQVYSNLIRHPKTTNLADELGLTSKDTGANVVAAGMLVSLWLWAAQNATNGDLSSCSDRAIAEAAEYKRKPSAFVNALIKTKWLDPDRKLHDWEEYATLLNDCAEEQKKKTRERVKRHRERKKAAAMEDVTPNCNNGCNVTDTPGNGPTIPNHTIPYHTNTLTGADADEARAREASSEMLALIGLKPGEYLEVSQGRVEDVIWVAEELFRKYCPTRKPNPMDYRMVFLLSSPSGNWELLDYAFETAHMADKANDWRYIAGVVRNLRARNIESADQARCWDEERPDLSGRELEAAEMNGKINDFHRQIRVEGA